MAVSIPGLPKVPDKPHFKTDHDALWFILTNPCGTPPWVLVSTAFNPALQAAIELVWIDTEDILSNYAGPRGAKGGFLGTKKGARGKRRRKPNLSQQLGSAIDDVLGHPLDGDTNKRWKSGQLLMWGLYEIADRFAWAFLLMGVTEDFLINWASLIYAETKDPLKCPDGLTAKGDGGGTTPIAGWTSLLAPDVTYQRGNCSWVILFGTVGAGKWNVTAAFDGEIGPGSDDHIQAQIGLFRDPFFIQPIEVSPLTDFTAPGSGGLVVSAQITGPEVFYAAIRSGLGNWNSSPNGALVTIRELGFV